MNRETGYYWVKYYGEDWTIGFYYQLNELIHGRLWDVMSFSKTLTLMRLEDALTEFKNL